MGVEEQDDEPSSVVERGGTEVEREGEGWLFGECVLVTAALFGVAMKERDDGMERNRFVTNFNRMNTLERFRQKRQNESSFAHLIKSPDTQAGHWQCSNQVILKGGV